VALVGWKILRQPSWFYRGGTQNRNRGKYDETPETPETPETAETAETVFFLLRELSFTNWFITCAN
jgi:hypothetical protein